MAKLSAKTKAKNLSQKNFSKKLSKKTSGKRGGVDKKKKILKRKNESAAKRFASRRDRPDWALDDITGQELNGNGQAKREDEMDIGDLMDMMDKDSDHEVQASPNIDYEEQHRLKLVHQKEVAERKKIQNAKGDKSKRQQQQQTEESAEEGEDTNDVPKSLDIASRPFVELYAQRASTLSDIKLRFARIGLAVMEHPSENVYQLREYFRVLDATNEDPEYGVIFFSAQKLALQSLAAVFGDILPTYRVALHTPTPAAPGQQLKRDTMALYAYEKSLLSCYQLYLQRLERCLTAHLAPASAAGRSNFYSVMLTTKKARARLALVACQCLGTLLENHSHFNEATKVITLLVNVLANTARASPTMRNIAAKAFEAIFEADKLGEVSLEITKILCHRILEVNFRVVPDVLRVFHRLNLRELINNQGELDIGGRELKEQAKKDRSQMSKAERKKAKELGKQSTHRFEAEAVESRDKRFRYKREIHKQLSALYFKFLKRCLEVAQTSKLLDAQDSEAIDFNQWYRPLFRTLLEGVVIFSVYLNEDVIYNLIDLIRKLIDCSQELEEEAEEDQEPSVVKLEPGERLDCLRTIFGIVTTTTAGNLLSIDFEQHYQLLYRLLSNVNVIEKETLAVVRVFQTMVLRRLKQINLKRVLAIVKRVMLLLPVVAKAETALAMLTMVKRVCQLSPLVGEHLFGVADDDEENEARPERLVPLSVDLGIDHLEMRSSTRVLQLLAMSHHDRYVRLLAQAMLVNFSGKHTEASGHYSSNFDLLNHPRLAKLSREMGLESDVAREILMSCDAADIYKRLKTSSMLIVRLQMAGSKIKKKKQQTL